MVQVNRYSGSDLNRVKEFVSHLFENPSIKNEPSLIGERFIINFIEKNSQELSVIFKSQDFFPNLDPGEVIDLILDDIYNRVYASSLPPINRFLDNSNLSFLDTLSETGVVDDIHRKRSSMISLLCFSGRGKCATGCIRLLLFSDIMLWIDIFLRFSVGRSIFITRSLTLIKLNRKLISIFG
jgi:hypothetical protein